MTPSYIFICRSLWVVQCYIIPIIVDIGQISVVCRRLVSPQYHIVQLRGSSVSLVTHNNLFTHNRSRLRFCCHIHHRSTTITIQYIVHSMIIIIILTVLSTVPVSHPTNRPTNKISLYPLYLWLCSLSACAYCLPRLFPSVHPPTASQSASVARLVVQVVICNSQFTQINTQNWSNDDPDIIEIRKW